MRPGQSKPKSAKGLELETSPVAPAEDTTLTRGELFHALCLGLAVAGVAFGLAWFIGHRDKATLASPQSDRPRRLVAFDLVERSGGTITRAAMEGKILVVNFVFTSCSLSCRAVNNRMQEIQRRVTDMPEVQLVSLTVDPRTDTPSVLAKFADSFHADPDRWLFLTGDKAEVYRVIETSFIARSSELESLIPGGFASTDRIMLVDQKGGIAASFNGLRRGVVSAVLAEIEKLRESDVAR